MSKAVLHRPTEAGNYHLVPRTYSDDDLRRLLTELVSNGKYKECTPYISILESRYPQNQQLKILRCRALLDSQEYLKAIYNAATITEPYLQCQTMVVAHLGLDNLQEALLWYQKWRRIPDAPTNRNHLICGTTMARIIAICLFSGQKQLADNEFSQWVLTACKRKDYNIKGILTAPYSILSSASYDEEDYECITKIILAILSNWSDMVIKDGSEHETFSSFVFALHGSSSEKGHWIFTVFGALSACRMGQHKMALFYLGQYHNIHPSERIPHICTIPLKCLVEPDSATEYYIASTRLKFSSDYPSGVVLRQCFERLVEFMSVSLGVNYIK